MRATKYTKILKERVIAEISKKVKKLDWICLAEDCEETCINSHFLQKKGILNRLSESGFLIEARMIDPNHWQKRSEAIEFVRVGLNKALSLNVFCRLHDSEIFKPIESSNPDFTSLNSFLLLSYRVTCAELRKKQINLTTFVELFLEESLDGEINKEMILLFCNGFEIGISELFIIKSIFEIEIKNNTNSFVYQAHIYEKLDVYASAIFSPIDDDIPTAAEFDGLANVYIHILPRADNTIILVGYHRDCSTPWIEDYANSWGNLCREDLEYKLTDLFASRIENWGMSETVFKGIKPEILQKYIKFIKTHALNVSEDLKVDFNLFEK